MRYVIGLVVLCLVGFLPFLHYSSVEHLSGIKVTEKERITTGTESKYLVFTVNEAGEPEVFENTDALLFLKTNSSDVYAELGVNQKCDLKVNWYRVSFFSVYRNIISADCK